MKATIIILYSAILLLAGAGLYKKFVDRPIVINYPAVEVAKAIEHQPIFYLREIAIHKVKAETIYFDEYNNEHQVYVDSLDIDNDSLKLHIVASLDANIEKYKGVWKWLDIQVEAKPLIVTITEEVEKIVMEYKDVPFFKNNWFYAWFIQSLTVLGLIIVSVF